MPTHCFEDAVGPHQDADIITDQLLKLVEEARVGGSCSFSLPKR